MKIVELIMIVLILVVNGFALYVTFRKVETPEGIPEVKELEDKVNKLEALLLSGKLKQDDEEKKKPVLFGNSDVYKTTNFWVGVIQGEDVAYVDGRILRRGEHGVYGKVMLITPEFVLCQSRYGAKVIEYGQEKKEVENELATQKRL